MIEFDFLGLIICTFSIFVYFIVLWKKNNVIDNIVSIVFIVYIICLVGVVFFPIPFQKSVIEIHKNYGYGKNYNIIPFKSIIEILRDDRSFVIMRQLGGNLILLFPLGIYIPIAIKNKKIINYCIIFVCTSIAIEIMQFMIGKMIGYNYRVVDVDDVILNTIGAFAGIIICKLIVLPIYNYLVNVIENKNTSVEEA
ncbi:Glycopeptide antibiotics resistance protein [Eubacterium uniforme]|uniref:Glycopeptide antibiotics resistance protein n=1 Tax=Eubacterium uniforme TaxID=39495 RepID=A0A1T4VTC6_9FIRM|nr:VanZ family protein [Eubacterium uniforme]SKA68088.1 Glycopeptide antibiotics resistance protein [Eubacterium uniforme]